MTIFRDVLFSLSFALGAVATAKFMMTLCELNEVSCVNGEANRVRKRQAAKLAAQAEEAVMPQTASWLLPELPLFLMTAVATHLVMSFAQNADALQARPPSNGR